jgi:hypothetical protein
MPARGIYLGAAALLAVTGSFERRLDAARRR